MNSMFSSFDTLRLSGGKIGDVDYCMAHRYNRRRRRRGRRSIDYFESRKSTSVGSGCKHFIEKADKLTSLLSSYNIDGIKDLEEFTSITTYIMNATELHGRIIDSECNKTELKELRDVHSKSGCPN